MMCRHQRTAKAFKSQRRQPKLTTHTLIYTNSSMSPEAAKYDYNPAKNPASLSAKQRLNYS